MGFVDPTDFFANVPTTKMLLNKMFMLHKQRDVEVADCARGGGVVS